MGERPCGGVTPRPGRGGQQGHYPRTFLQDVPSRSPGPLALEGTERELRPHWDAMVRWREALHRDPELSNHEERTREKVLGALRSLGIRGAAFGPGFGVLGVIAPRARGTCVLLRADMDALPVTEETGAPFASTNAAMHACGHDIHMAALLGAAARLKVVEEELPGPVKLLFQPAEEEGHVGGALPMIRAGVLERAPRVDRVFGLHVDYLLPLGSFGFCPGPMMAAPDHVEITVEGRGGHAAYPQAGVDPVVLASEIILALQTLISRERAPTDPVVLSITHVSAGSKDNIIPDRVWMEGTLRTFRPETRRRMAERIRARADGIARSAGGRARVAVTRGYPPTVNDPAVTTLLEAAFRKDFPQRVRRMTDPLLGAEDFSYFLEKKPGMFLRLGTSDGAGGSANAHSSKFLPDPRALLAGAASHLLAVRALQAGPGSR